MIVVVANNIPPAVRGRMKLWFVEPRPNVFVAGIKGNKAEKVINFLFMHCNQDSGLMIFAKESNAPGYKIHTLGETSRKLIDISGLQLVLDLCKK